MATEAAEGVNGGSTEAKVVAAVSDETGTFLRSTDYAIGTVQTALAIGSLPASRRSDWWVLGMLAPLAAAGTREYVRARFVPDAKISGVALVLPALAALVGSGVLIATRYAASRPQRMVRCRR